MPARRHDARVLGLLWMLLMGCGEALGPSAEPLESGAHQAGVVTLPGAELLDGVPVTVSGDASSLTYFQVRVPAGLTEVSFALTGGTGNAHLAIRRGEIPTSTVYDCSSRGFSNEERCNVPSPVADTWSVRVEGSSAYANAKLVVYFNQPLPLFPNTVVSATTNKPTMYFVDVPAAKGRLQFQVTGNSLVKARFGARPTETLHDCVGAACDIFKPRSGRYYVLLSNQVSGNQLMASVTGTVKPTVTLSSGQTVTGISASRDDLLYYTLNVPTGQARLAVETSSVVRALSVQPSDPYPGSAAVDCLATAPTSGGASCTIDNPKAGTWYVVLRATNVFSGLNLTARVVASTGSGTVTVLQNHQQVTGLSGGTMEDRYYSLSVPAGMPFLNVRTTQQTGLAEVFVQQGVSPKRGEGTSCGSGCTFPSPAPGTWFILVRGYTTFSGLSFSAGVPSVSALWKDTSLQYSSERLYYVVDVPEGQTEATFTLASEHNNWAMVKYGAWSTHFSDGCRSPCTLYRPQAGRYYVTVYYTSGIVFGSLTAGYGGGPVAALTDGVPEAFTSGVPREFRYWRLDVPAGQTHLRVDHAFPRATQTQLYVRYGEAPATFQFTCKATAWTYNDAPPGQSCLIEQPQEGAWYVLVASASAFDGIVRATTSSTLPGLTPGLEEPPFGGAPGGERVWTVEVPPGLSDFRVMLTGGTGNADLYVKHGEAPGTTYDCASMHPNNEEDCEFAHPLPGTWYVAVRGTESFANARLLTTLATTPGEGVRTLGNGENVVALKGSLGSVQYFQVEVPPGKNRLMVGLSGGRGNANLAIRQGARPTLSEADCRSQSSTNLEICVIENPTPGTWLIRVEGETDFKDGVLTARHGVAQEVIPLTLGTPVPNIYLGPNETQVFSVTIPSSSDMMRVDVQAGVNAPTDVRFADVGVNSHLSCTTSGPFTLCPHPFVLGGPKGQRLVSVRSRTPASASWGTQVTVVAGITSWNADTTHPSLMNGVAVAELTGDQGFRIQVPTGARKLTFSTRGPTETASDPGRVALYVQNLKPASSTKYVCSSTGPGISQGCTYTDPPAGTWYLATSWTSGAYDVKVTFE
ncbi:PPC domain-containing protein [Archangium primigenium]|uniref:PPC domain-containing protein n=1 Tax=[Archangium] primigenium TaxID=2792470 RepID=UPI00195C72AC|nr:PPC domain-containing protein [Archangium primigenium]